MSRGPTMRDRVEVHRSVEHLRACGTWPDELDFQDDAIGALQALSDEIAFDAMQEEQRKLLVSELRRELRRRPNVAEPVDHSPDATVQTILHPERCSRPNWSDAIGELAGREPNANQLLFRPRAKRRPDSRYPRGIGDRTRVKRQWSSGPRPDANETGA